MLKNKLGNAFQENFKSFKIILFISLILNFLLITFCLYLILLNKSVNDTFKTQLESKNIETSQLQSQIESLRIEKEQEEKTADLEKECKISLGEALDFSERKIIAKQGVYHEKFVSVEVPKTWCSPDLESAFFITPEDKKISINLQPWVGGFPPDLDIQYSDTKSTINGIEIEKRIFLENGRYSTMNASFEMELNGEKLANLIFFSFPTTRQQEFMGLYDKILTTAKVISLEEAEEIWKQEE